MAREHNPPMYGDCPEGTPIAQQAPHAARADRGGGSRPMSVMPFLRIVSLFDLESFLRPDPRASRVRRLAILLRCMSPSERGVIWKMEDGPRQLLRSTADRCAALTDGSTRQTAATT